MRSIARNTATILGGQCIPLVVGVCTLPLLTRQIGTERLGVLTLVWVTVGYFSVLDLGIGRAVTNSVAECLGRNEAHKAPEIFWTAVICQLLMGCLAAAAILVAAPLLINNVIKVSPSLHDEVLRAFQICSIALPIVFTSSTAVGMLEASARFDFSVSVQTPTAILQYVLPFGCAIITTDLSFIVGAIVVARAASLSVAFLLCCRTYPDLLLRRRWNIKRSKKLLQYGGWVTISNVASPLLLYSDRFVIGSVLGLAAVAFYAIPLDTGMRMLVVPGALSSVLFPYFSRFSPEHCSEKVAGVIRDSLRFVLVSMGVLCLFLFVYSEDILKIWLGGEFAEKSNAVLRVLLVGILGNSLARIPYSFLYGAGYVKTTALVHVSELIIQIPATMLAVRMLGLSGAALVWALRNVTEAFLLFFLSHKKACLPLGLVIPSKTVWFISGLILLAGGSIPARSTAITLYGDIAVFFGLLLATGLLASATLLEGKDIVRAKAYLTTCLR